MVDCEPEVPDSDLRPDVIAIKPIKRLASLRLGRGSAPIGILHVLDTDRYTLTGDIIERTGFPDNFVHGVLNDSEKEGWVISAHLPGGETGWKIADYEVPVREILFLCCAHENALHAGDTLRNLKGYFDRGYMVFPYAVDGKFLHECHLNRIGVLVFSERHASFTEMLHAHKQRVTNIRAYCALAERAIADCYLAASPGSKKKAACR